ncbi:hypothetical protein Hdeb2414_s0001g00039221 [Helianthus debilis subsp. tardiflorus]
MIHFCKWKQHMDPFFGTRSHIKTTHRSPRDIPETPTGGQSRCRDRDHVDIISFTVSVIMVDGVYASREFNSLRQGHIFGVSPGWDASNEVFNNFNE